MAVNKLSANSQVRHTSTNKLNEDKTMGIERITINKPWELLDMTEAEYMAWNEADMKNWCQEHDGAESYYHRDGETPTPICPQKHHYHCEQCHKLTQIG